MKSFSSFYSVESEDGENLIVVDRYTGEISFARKM
jgi:hypothetical protein